MKSPLLCVAPLALLTAGTWAFSPSTRPVSPTKLDAAIDMPPSPIESEQAISTEVKQIQSDIEESVAAARGTSEYAKQYVASVRAQTRTSTLSFQDEQAIDMDNLKKTVADAKNYVANLKGVSKAVEGFLENPNEPPPFELAQFSDSSAAAEVLAPPTIKKPTPRVTSSSPVAIASITPPKPKVTSSTPLPDAVSSPSAPARKGGSGGSGMASYLDTVASASLPSFGDGVDKAPPASVAQAAVVAVEAPPVPVSAVAEPAGAELKNGARLQSFTKSLSASLSKTPTKMVAESTLEAGTTDSAPLPAKSLVAEDSTMASARKVVATGPPRPAKTVAVEEESTSASVRKAVATAPPRPAKSVVVKESTSSPLRKAVATGPPPATPVVLTDSAISLARKALEQLTVPSPKLPILLTVDPTEPIASRNGLSIILFSGLVYQYTQLYSSTTNNSKESKALYGKSG